MYVAEKNTSKDLGEENENTEMLHALAFSYCHGELDVREFPDVEDGSEFRFCIVQLACGFPAWIPLGTNSFSAAQTIIDMAPDFVQMFHDGEIGQIEFDNRADVYYEMQAEETGWKDEDVDEDIAAIALNEELLNLKLETATQKHKVMVH